VLSRRGLAGASGLLAIDIPGLAEAKKKKRKNKKITRNEFGCVNVGGKCQGKSANCCSGICQGKKPKRGKKDTSLCVAHDNLGICFADSDTCTVGLEVPCNPDNPACSCVLTTGNAGFCGDFTAGIPAVCRVCARDADCQADLGPGAACVFLGGICSPLCAATGRTACVPACAVEAP
jgi:hypothetical protein